MLKPKAYTWLFLILLLVSSGSLFELMRRFDPFHARYPVLVIFYALVFISIVSLTTLIGFFARTTFFQKGIRYEFLRVARRQGVWFGFVVFGILALKAANLFSMWTGILLVLVFFSIEFLAVKKL
ncbi:MAG: hypothetical protein Q8R08_00710 [bacterium]|nr:hypothetical protein [bacterium]